MVQSLWKTVWRFLNKLKMELPYDPANPLLGIYPKKMKTQIPKNTCKPMFRSALFTVAKMWKQPKCPSTGEWIKKMGWVGVCTHMCVCVCVYTHTQWNIIQP